MQKKLSDAIVEKAAEIIEQDSTCTKHKSQPLVAFDSTTQTFACV